jgi:hypothetical protein
MFKTNITALFILLAFHCIGYTQDKITIKEFTDQPFPYTISILNLSTTKNPRFKVTQGVFKNQKLQSDTIYSFTKGKTKLLINKSGNKEVFIGGIIRNRKIRMNGNIQIGITKNEFLKVFSDINDFEGDVVTFESNDYENNFIFIFRKNKLKLIKINNKKH